MIKNAVVGLVAVLITAGLLWATDYPGGGGGDATPSLTELVAGQVTMASGGDFISGGTTGSNLGATATPWDDIFVADELEHGGDTNTRINFFPDEQYFYAGRTTLSFRISNVGADFTEFTDGGEDTDFFVRTTVSDWAFYIDDGLEEAHFGVPVGHTTPTNTNTVSSVTVDGGGAQTFIVNSNTMFVNCTGAETIGTITGAPAGMHLVLIVDDTDCTFTDDPEPVAANAFGLAAGDFVGATAAVLTLIYDGGSWVEAGRTVDVP